jgi:hypothetical protein
MQSHAARTSFSLAAASGSTRIIYWRVFKSHVILFQINLQMYKNIIINYILIYKLNTIILYLLADQFTPALCGGLAKKRGRPSRRGPGGVWSLAQTQFNCFFFLQTLLNFFRFALHSLTLVFAAITVLANQTCFFQKVSTFFQHFFPNIPNFFQLFSAYS